MARELQTLAFPTAASLPPSREWEGTPGALSSTPLPFHWTCGPSSLALNTPGRHNFLGKPCWGVLTPRVFWAWKQPFLPSLSGLCAARAGRAEPLRQGKGAAKSHPLDIPQILQHPPESSRLGLAAAGAQHRILKPTPLWRRKPGHPEQPGNTRGGAGGGCWLH